MEKDLAGQVDRPSTPHPMAPSGAGRSRALDHRSTALTGMLTGRIGLMLRFAPSTDTPSPRPSRARRLTWLDRSDGASCASAPTVRGT